MFNWLLHQQKHLLIWRGDGIVQDKTHGAKKGQMQVSLDWRHFNTTQYWVISVDTFNVYPALMILVVIFVRNSFFFSSFWWMDQKHGRKRCSSKYRAKRVGRYYVAFESDFKYTLYLKEQLFLLHWLLNIIKMYNCLILVQPTVCAFGLNMKLFTLS